MFNVWNLQYNIHCIWTLSHVCSAFALPPHLFDSKWRADLLPPENHGLVGQHLGQLCWVQPQELRNPAQSCSTVVASSVCAHVPKSTCAARRHGLSNWSVYCMTRIKWRRNPSFITELYCHLLCENTLWYNLQISLQEVKHTKQVLEGNKHCAYSSGCKTVT